jgi:hypothetical protein
MEMPANLRRIKTNIIRHAPDERSQPLRMCGLDRRNHSIPVRRTNPSANARLVFFRIWQ